MYILKNDRRIFFSAQTCLSRDVALDSIPACISELLKLCLWSLVLIVIYKYKYMFTCLILFVKK